MGCMKHMMTYLRWARVALAALLVLVGCAKADLEGNPDREWAIDPFDDHSGENGLAIGTLESKDGARYIKLSENTCSKVMNPTVVEDIPDHTRIFLEFRYVVASQLASCYTDAILVEWASPIDQGSMSLLNFEEAFGTESIQSATYGDPMDIVTDWMTTLEDGFLTLHYQIPTSGEKKHRFALYQSLYNYNDYYLVHQADGDTKGSVTDGIVCFDVAAILPKTEGKTVELSLVYIDLNHTEKRLTVEYCSPK